MRRISLLFIGFLVSISVVKAQDTLLFENFNDTAAVGSWWTNAIFDFPPGIADDTSYYVFDEDAETDANSRPSSWFLNLGGGFADVDSSDWCLMSSSWFSSPAQASNWFFLPAIQITDGASAWLKWKSAPRQTPYFLDGFEIVISTTVNDFQSAYTDVVYTAAEYTAGAVSNGNNYAAYTFSPGWVHGADGLFVQCNNCSVPDSSGRQIGVQRPDSISLAAYDNMKIYIAFHHNAFDDNLISVDDILVMENTDPTFSIENVATIEGQVYPNPATDYVNVKFDAEKYHHAKVQLINNSGQVIYASNLTSSYNRVDLQNVAAGIYFVKLIADEGNMVQKIIVNK